MNYKLVAVHRCDISIIKVAELLNEEWPKSLNFRYMKLTYIYIYIYIYY